MGVTIIIVLVNGVQHLKSHLHLTIRLRPWLSSSQPGVLHALTGNPKSCSVFELPLSPGRSIGNLWLQHNFHFLFLIPSCFPNISEEMPDPVAFLLPTAPKPCCSSSLSCSKPADKEKHPYDSWAEWQRGGEGWRGPRSPGELFLGKLQSALSVHLPIVQAGRGSEGFTARGDPAGGH